MHIDILKIDAESFMVHEHVVNGEVMYLVQPIHAGSKWSKDTLHFRSSVWDSNGNLVSASFPKFFDYGQQPELSPVPTDLRKCVFVQKVDGSTLICSKNKNNYIIRTRGTLDAKRMEKNSHEIEQFKTEILSKLANDVETWDYSIIFEWVSPLNRIVILYPEPKWYLIGMIYHSDYSLMPQESLNVMAEKYGLLRPPLYSFDNINSVQEIVESVKAWVGIEGIVIYSNNGQVLHRTKGLDYLARHRLKSELASFEKLVDFWFTVGKPNDFKVFWNEVEKLTDYETAHERYGDISRIIDAWKEVQKIISGMQEFVDKTLQPLPSRKDQALKVLSSYGQGGRSGMIFKFLDSRPLIEDDLKKLLYQCLKAT